MLNVFRFIALVDGAGMPLVFLTPHTAAIHLVDVLLVGSCLTDWPHEYQAKKISQLKDDQRMQNVDAGLEKLKFILSFDDDIFLGGQV